MDKPQHGTETLSDPHGERRKDRDCNQKPKRRRRKPEAAESEILDAAEGFLKERPFREMTVDDVMTRTGLARPSFYEYFRDRYQLITRLFERLGDLSYLASELWFSERGDPLQELKQGMENLVGLYIERGYLLRALADAAVHDQQADEAHRKLLDRLIDAVAARVRAGIATGEIRDLPAEEVATALVLMDERYLIERLESGSRADPALLAETLFVIWKRILYGV